MNDLPTTAAGGIWNSLMSAVASILPHGDSHEPNGTDPVLGGIRFLGYAEKTVEQTTSSVTGVDVTDLAFTFHSRGGDILIVVAGSRAVGTVGATGCYWNALIDTVSVAEYSEASGLGRKCDTLAWFASSISPGPHALTLQFRVGDASATVYAARLDLVQFILAFEILPLGQQ